MITDISTDWGVNPRIVRVTTTDDYDTVVSTGYVFSQAEAIKEIQNGQFTWLDGDLIAIFYNFGDGIFTYDPTSGTFVPNGSGGSVAAVVGTANQINVDSTNPEAPVVSIAPNAILPGNEGVTLPSGDDAQRPGSPNFAQLRGNTQSLDLEYWDGATWIQLPSGEGSGNVTTDGLATVNSIPVFTTAFNIESSAASDSGTLFTINYGEGPQFLVSESGTVSTLNNTLDDGSGNLLTIGNVTVGGIGGAGQNLFLPTNTYNTYDPTIISSNSGIGGYSSLTLDSDNFVFNIDPSQTFTVNTPTPTLIFGVAGNGEVITLNNTLDDGSGNLLTTGNVTIGQDGTGSTLFMPINDYDTYNPNAVASNNDGFSLWTFSADAFTYNIDEAAQGQFLIQSGFGTALNVNAEGSVTTKNNTLDDGSGNLSTTANITIAQGGGGGTLSMPINDFDTYSLAAISSTNDGFSLWTFNSDMFTFNMDAASEGQFLLQSGLGPALTVAAEGSVTTKNNTLDNGTDGTMTINGAFHGNASGAQYSQAFSIFSSVIGSSGDNVFNLNTTSPMPTFNTVGANFSVDGSDNTGYATYFNVSGADASEEVGLVTTLYNTLDDGSGNAGITGNLTSNNGKSSQITLGNDGSGNASLFFVNSAPGSYSMTFEPYSSTMLHSCAISIQSGEIPVAFGSNVSGLQIYAVVDGDTGFSVPYYQDEGGNNFAWGTGGGSGSVTEVGTTSDLTVDGTPGASITTSGTLGLIDVGTANTYAYPTSLTTDAKGRVSAITAGSAPVSSITFAGGLTADPDNPITTTGTVEIIANWLFADIPNDNLFCGTSNNDISGEGNVFVGAESGNAVTTANNCIYIGFIATGADNLTNSMAIGYNSIVSDSNAFVYGNDSVSHGFGTSTPVGKVHVFGGQNTGENGQLGAWRLNGINDVDNTWPVSDIVWTQNAIITDGVETENLLIMAISDAYNGCVTNCTVWVSGIIGNDGPGFSGVYGQVNVSGMFDGTNYWINGSPSASPQPITLTLTSSDTTMALASAQVYLSSGGSPDLVVQVTGVNSYFVNWNGYAQYFTTQSVANVG